MSDALGSSSGCELQTKFQLFVCLICWSHCILYGSNPFVQQRRAALHALALKLLLQQLSHVLQFTHI